MWTSRRSIEAGHLIHVSIPEDMQLTSPGVVVIYIRTVSGGQSRTGSELAFMPPPQRARSEAANAIDQKANNLRSGQGGFVPSAGTAKTGPKSDDPGQFRGGFVPGAGIAKTGTKSNDPAAIDPNRIPVAPLPIASSPAMTAGAVYVTPNGQRTKGEVRGNRLYLHDAQSKVVPAADGAYRGAAGSLIVVKGGIIVEGGRVPSASSQNPTASAVRQGGPGGIKAIGAQRDDPTASAQFGRQTTSGIQDDTVMPVGTKVIPPKDAPIAPSIGGAAQHNSGVQGGIGTPGGIKPIAPKPKESAVPTKAGAQGVIAPIDVGGVQPPAVQPMRQMQ
jgi:hypothetical protein